MMRVRVAETVLMLSCLVSPTHAQVRGKLENLDRTLRLEGLAKADLLKE